jgi:hypothetical protein
MKLWSLPKGLRPSVNLVEKYPISTARTSTDLDSLVFIVKLPLATRNVFQKILESPSALMVKLKGIKFKVDLSVHRHSESARVLLDLKKDDAKWTSLSNLASVKYTCGPSGSPAQCFTNPAP